MTWLDIAVQTPVVDVISRLGREYRRAPSADHCQCPACGAERRHPSRGDRRGAVGISHAKPCCWRCHECAAGGDAIDFIAWALGGARFRELDGMRKSRVREWFRDSCGIGRAEIEYRRAPVAAVPAHVWPPSDELRAMWADGKSVRADEACRTYLESRGIDADAVARQDLAFGLGWSSPPAWAFVGELNWARSGHRLIVPLFGVEGRMRSVLARSVEKAPHLKSVAPRGCTRAGLVMANRVAMAMLRKKARPSEVAIREGEIDFLQEAIANQHAAVFGVISGSWTDAFAASIPDNAQVVIATDADDAGDKYAAAIAATLIGRVRCERKREAA